MSKHCEHEYVQPIEHETTGDLVTECCHCDSVLGVAHPPEPSASPIDPHWYDHKPGDAPHMQLAADLLNGFSPPREAEDERYIQICGNCQHWIGAVHGAYFDRLDEPLDERTGGFVDGLRESLCPECGVALFRWSILVMSHSDATQVENENINLTDYVKSRADARFWSGESGPGFPPSTFVGQQMFGFGYEPRCPCCGYAERYGDREFDFHHWDYDEDVGVMLCRRCHSHIHRDMTASEQDDLTGDWKADAKERLYDRATTRLEFGDAIRFAVRFNIKDTASVIDLVE